MVVYRGPQQITVLKRGLAQLLRRDGFEHVSDAVDVTLAAMTADHARPAVLIPFDFLDGGLASERAPSADAVGLRAAGEVTCL